MFIIHNVWEQRSLRLGASEHLHTYNEVRPTLKVPLCSRRAAHTAWGATHGGFLVHLCFDRTRHMGSQVAFSSCDMLATQKASDFEAFWSSYFWMTDALNLYSYNLVFRTKQHLPYFHALCMIKGKKTPKNL